MLATQWLHCKGRIHMWHMILSSTHVTHLVPHKHTDCHCLQMYPVPSEIGKQQLHCCWLCDMSSGALDTRLAASAWLLTVTAQMALTTALRTAQYHVPNMDLTCVVVYNYSGSCCTALVVLYIVCVYTTQSPYITATSWLKSSKQATGMLLHTSRNIQLAEVALTSSLMLHGNSCFFNNRVSNCYISSICCRIRWNLFCICL